MPSIDLTLLTVLRCYEVISKKRKNSKSKTGNTWRGFTPATQHDTVEPVYNGHPLDLRNWPLNAGGHFIQGH